MSEFEDKIKQGPNLTLDPASENIVMPKMETVTTKSAEQPIAEDIQIDDSIFSPEEKQQIEEFAQQIDITDNSMVTLYGVNAQKKLRDFSEKALENVRTKDLGEVGDMLSSVVSELREFDVNQENKSGIFKVFNRGKNKTEGLLARYDKAEANVDKISDMLEDHQVRLMKDTSMLEQMFQLNNVYYKEISMYILAGKKRLTEIYNNDLQTLRKKAESTNLPEDVQAVRDLSADCDRFDKKLHDLQMSRMIAIQTAPQLRLLQNNDNLMIEKIQSTLFNTIPLWKNQMVIALGLNHATQAAKAQREVANTTNELLKRNADALHAATVDTVKESNRDIVDIETLKNTNEKLIQTFDEVMQIQNEGRQKRVEAEKELQTIEDQLKQKIMEISK